MTTITPSSSWAREEEDSKVEAKNRKKQYFAMIRFSSKCPLETDWVGRMTKVMYDDVLQC